MTTNLTSGTQINVDPSTLPITWTPGTNYTIRLNPGYVQEVGGNHLSSPVQTVSASIATFNTVPNVTQVSPIVGTTGVYTTTVAIAYQRNIHQDLTKNYYLWSGTNLIATIPGSSTRIRAQSKSTIVGNVQQIIPLNTTTEIYNHIQMEFRPVNTSSFTATIFPAVLRYPPNVTTDEPAYDGTEFQLYFNDLLLPDGNVVGQNPTYYKYFVIPAGQPVYFNTGTQIFTEDKFYIQAYRLNKSDNQPNQYGDQTEPVQPKIFAEWASLSTGTIKIPYSTVVYSTLTNKQILIDLTGYILPNTHYHINADEGIVYDMFNFISPSVNNVLDWTSGDGPSIVDYQPSYNTTTNVTSATLKFSKPMSLNTGNFYLKNNLGTVRIIPVIGSSVSLLNTNTVSINIDNIPTPEDSYHITWDQGVVVDNNSIAIYGVEDATPLRFYDQMMSGMTVRQYNHTTSTSIFTTSSFTHLFNSYSVGVPKIVEAGAGTYELRLSSSYGVFTHPTVGTDNGTYWSLTGTPAYINSYITGIKFTPEQSNGQDTSYEWKLLRNGVVIYDQIFDLYGTPYQLPIYIPGDPNSVSPTNISTLTLTVGSLGVVGEPVTLTANINSYLQLGGTVQFKVGNTLIGSADMDSSGIASTTTLFYSTGSRTITAYWLGGLLPNGTNYGTLTSNTASVFIDAYAYLNGAGHTYFAITSSETPEIITNDNVFVATANTSTVIIGPVTFGVYNTSTKQITRVLGTSSFVNNSATITVNSGTLAVGTYTIAAIWTGSNVTPKFYASTVTMTQVYGDKSPSKIIARGPSFYWHNIDGYSLNDQATADITVSGSYTRHQPTGIVKLFDGSVLLDTMDLSQRTTFVWNPSSFNEIDAGIRLLTVQYLGDQWNLPVTTNQVIDPITNTSSTFTVSATSRRNSSMRLIGTNTTVYRPYGVAQFTATTTSTYWNNKLINIYDGINNVGTAAVIGSTATFTFDSKAISTGIHNIRTEYPQDWAYTEIFSNIATITIDKTTLPITLTRNSSTVLRPNTVTLTIGSTASFYTNEIVQIYDNGQPWFTATYTGTSITLTTSSSYFSTGTHIIKAGIAEDFNYKAVESSTSSIFIDKSTIPLSLNAGYHLLSNIIPQGITVIPGARMSGGGALPPNDNVGLLLGLKFTADAGTLNYIDNNIVKIRGLNEGYLYDMLNAELFQLNFNNQLLSSANQDINGNSVAFGIYSSGTNYWLVALQTPPNLSSVYGRFTIEQSGDHYEIFGDFKNEPPLLPILQTATNLSPVYAPSLQAAYTATTNKILWPSLSTGTVSLISTKAGSFTTSTTSTFNAIITSTESYSYPVSLTFTHNGVSFKSAIYTGTSLLLTLPFPGTGNFNVLFDGDINYNFVTSNTINLS